MGLRSKWRRTRTQSVLYGWRMRLAGPHLTLPSGVVAHLDPSDDRARKIHQRQADFDQAALAQWRTIVDQLDPTVVVDVGANYGAFGLDRLGPRIHLVEPHPAVLQYLSRTVDGLADVTLHPVAASDEDGAGVLRFWRHRKGANSGGSSLVRWPDAKGVEVPLRRVDGLVEVGPDDRVAIKVDVEGAEVGALDGMSGIMGAAGAWVALVETDAPEQLRRFGSVEQVTGRDYLIRPV